MGKAQAEMLLRSRLANKIAPETFSSKAKGMQIKQTSFRVAFHESLRIHEYQGFKNPKIQLELDEFLNIH